MINGQSPALVLVHYRERGAGYRGAASKSGNETFGEQCLAAAQFAFESQHGAGIHILRKLPPDGFRLSGAVGNECSHGAIFDFRFSILESVNQFELAATSEIFLAILVATGRCHAAKRRRVIRSPRLLK